jgi:hypothetical protein
MIVMLIVIVRGLHIRSYRNLEEDPFLSTSFGTAIEQKAFYTVISKMG